MLYLSCGGGGDDLHSFHEEVYELVAQIPYGKVISYGQIAWMLGHPRAARAVGRAMRCCPDALPWHRVVLSDGSIAGGTYAELRKALLQAEGIAFCGPARVDMKLCCWRPRPQ